MIFLYPVVPVPAPRQVQKDKFNPSDHVQRYRAYRDELKLLRLEIPANFHHVVFCMPMPFGWSVRKREQHDLRPHLQTPDRDNLEKALLDSALDQDCAIWNGQTTKLWAQVGFVLVSSVRLNPDRFTRPHVNAGLYDAYKLSLAGGKQRLSLNAYQQHELTVFTV